MFKETKTLDNMLNAFTAKYKDNRKTPNDIFHGYFKIVSISTGVFTAEAEPPELFCKKIFLNIWRNSLGKIGA